MTFYGFLADVVVFIHLCYMGYAVFGQLLILVGWPLGWRWIRNPWFRCTHLAMIVFVAGEAVVSFECPLTTWEGQLRVAAGQVQGGDLDGVSFTGQLLRKIQFAGGEYWPEYIDTSYYVAAAIVVVTAFLVPPRFRRRKSVAQQEPTPQSVPPPA